MGYGRKLKRLNSGGLHRKYSFLSFLLGGGKKNPRTRTKHFRGGGMWKSMGTKNSPVANLRTKGTIM